MDKYKIGMSAMSLAGHDAGKVYLIFKVHDNYVELVDGKIRTLDHPKKKKKKHIQIIKEQYDIAAADDVAIKRILKVRDKSAK